MADNRYVSIDYVESGYDEVQNTAWYIESGYFELGYVIQGITQSGEAALSAASVVSATSARTKSGSVSATSTSTFTAQAVKVFGAGTSLTAVTTLTVIPLQIVAAELTAFNNISLTANAGKIHGADTTINSLATVSATSLRIQPAAADFTAFNTVVTAAGRIRPAVDIVISLATLTASPTKVFGASTNTFATYDATPFPITGVVAEFTAPDYYSGLQLDYRVDYVYNQSLTFSNQILAWYSRSYSTHPTDYGTIFSWSGDGLNLAPIRVRLARNSLALGLGSSTIIFNNIPDTTELHHYALAFIDRYTLNTELYIDGIRHTDKSGGFAPDGKDWAQHGTLYIGRYRTIVNFGNPGGPNNYQVVESEHWDGELAQIWVGTPAPYYFGSEEQYTRITGYTRSTFQSLGPYGNLGNTQVQTSGVNTPSGSGTNSTLSQPAYYAEYSDADIGGYLPGTLNELYYAAYPLHGVFTLTPIGYTITYGEASVSANFSLTALIGYVKAVSSALSAEFATLATPYGFTKASATMQSAFAFTADPDEISSGVNIVLAEVSVSADADVIRSGVVVTTLFADIAITATTNQLASASLQAEATLSATPYDFTKASTVITATAELTGEGRLQARTRGTVQMQSAFSLSAEVLKIRTNSLQIAAQASVVTGIGGALRGGNISMTAFDTVLSAGKIIEFLTENTITVTEEQRLLQVALESTVLLVEMANGVNTVTAESTDTKVAEEQGILLAQYNTPN